MWLFLCMFVIWALCDECQILLYPKDIMIIHVEHVSCMVIVCWTWILKVDGDLDLMIIKGLLNPFLHEIVYNNIWSVS